VSRIALGPPHQFSIDPGSDWVADESDPTAQAQLGIYLRSIAHGLYVNARGEDSANRTTTKDGLFSLLREQNWASKPFDEWSAEANGLVIVGGTFETVGMNGEVVIEVYVSDGRRIANLAGPADRAIVLAATPSIRELAKTIAFD
jgi:hypothetical protein